MNLTHSDQKAMSVTLTAKQGRIFLKMVCLPMGNDFVVTLSGGDLEHIGAVAVSQTNASNIYEAQTSNTITNVITIPKHKEDCLAKSIASLLAFGLNGVVCVACGIHLDNILKTELEDIVEMSKEMANKLISQVAIH